jgi:diguanylate cyclase (GGDEF)-like protein
MQRIAILYDASQAVLSTFDLDEVFQRILNIVRDYFRLQNAGILLVDTEDNHLYVRSHYGRNNIGIDIRLPVGVGITGTSAKLKRPIYSPDVSKDPRYHRTDTNTRSELAIPLMVRDEVVGVLDFQSDEIDFFDNATIDLLTLFSTQAAIAIENARIHTLERRRALQLEAIAQIAQSATASLEINELLEKVCQQVHESFGADQVAILMQEDERLIVRAHAGSLTANIFIGESIPEGEGLSRRALESETTLLENDVAKSTGYVSGFAETLSEMCVPLIVQGEKLGVLVLDSKHKDNFSSTDIKPLESVAAICVTAILNARFVDRMRQLAYADGLTGLYNRRYFETRVKEELERAERYAGGMAVVMLDIDNFKKLNDEFGHLLGDETLRQISQIFQRQLRKVDVVCRYGGEEFVIILPATSGERALGVAEKLRKAIEEHDFPGIPRAVTISLGVAEYPQHGRTRDELVASADAALYAAKQHGRNMVLMSSPEHVRRSTAGR